MVHYGKEQGDAAVLLRRDEIFTRWRGRIETIREPENMEQGGEAIKVVASPNEKGNVSIVCRQCGTVKRLNVNEISYSEGAYRMNMKCEGCGSLLDVLINLRKAFRKPTNLTGICTTVESGDIDLDAHFDKVSGIVVSDISKTGIGFKMKTPLKIKQGDFLRVKFKLDTASRLPIEKKAIVRRVFGEYVGAEFTRPIDEREKELAFYVKY